MAQISPNVSSGPYTADGSQVAFPFTFSIVDTRQILVEVDGVSLSALVGYTVTFGDTSGTVTFGTAPALGAQVFFVSNPDYLQTSNFASQGAYNLDAVNQINRRHAIRELVLKDAGTRALKVPVGATPPPPLTTDDAEGRVLGYASGQFVWVPNDAAAVAGDVLLAEAAATTATGAATTATAQATLAEIAAAAAALASGIYANEAAGRAAVANGVRFTAVGSTSSIAVDIWQRVDSSSSTLLRSYPSLDSLNAAIVALNAATAIVVPVAAAVGSKVVTLGVSTALIPASAWIANSTIWAFACPNACTLNSIATQINAVGSGALNLVIATGTLPGPLTFVASYPLTTVVATGLKTWATGTGWSGTISIPAGAHVLLSSPSGGVVLQQQTGATGFTQYVDVSPFTSGTKTLSVASNTRFLARGVVTETAALQVPRTGLVDAAAVGASAISAEPASRITSTTSVAYNATLGEPGAGIFSANQICTLGAVAAAGVLETLTIDVSVLGSGALDLLVLNGTAPDFEIASSTALTATISGYTPNYFTSAQFGTINLTAGQTLALRLPAGGPTLFNVPQTGHTFYYNAVSVLSTGAGTLTAVPNSIIRAKFTVTQASIQIGAENLVSNLRGLSELAQPAAPTTFVMFLTAGQSNMQGAQPLLNPTAIPAGVAYQWYSGALTAVTGEIIGNSTGTSSLVAFANTFFARTGMGVIFVPSAIGGSGLAVSGVSGNWSSSGALRGTAITNLNAAKTAADSANLAWQFGGLLWAQGETDGDTIDAGGNALTGGLMTGAKYETEFGLLNTYMQAQAGAGMPIIISTLGTLNTGATAGYTAIRAAHFNLARTYSNVFIGFTGAKNFLARGLMYDTYHYMVQGYNEMGRSMAMTAAVRSVGRA